VHDEVRQRSKAGPALPSAAPVPRAPWPWAGASADAHTGRVPALPQFALRARAPP
jgi:hypothetical protein